MERRDHVLRTVNIWTDKAAIPVGKMFMIFLLITALLCSSAAGFVRLFFDADAGSEEAGRVTWMIRNHSADSHPVEAVKDEESSSATAFQLSFSFRESGEKNWEFDLRLFLNALMAAGLGLCLIPAFRRTSLVRWNSSTCSHTYTISYIFRLSFYDRSSLRR